MLLHYGQCLPILCLGAYVRPFVGQGHRQVMKRVFYGQAQLASRSASEFLHSFFPAWLFLSLNVLDGSVHLFFIFSVVFYGFYLCFFSFFFLPFLKNSWFSKNIHIFENCSQKLEKYLCIKTISQIFKKCVFNKMSKKSQNFTFSKVCLSISKNDWIFLKTACANYIFWKI